MAQTTYQVIVRDTSGAQKALFVGRGRYGPGQTKQGALISLNYWSRLRTSGAYTLIIDGRDERIAEFIDDAIIEIQRRDAQLGGSFSTVFEGFHRQGEFVRLQEGTDRFVSRGRGYNDLLAAEIILGAVGSSNTVKNGVAETVAKEYVDENIGPNAGTDALGNSRVMPGLTIEADAATGSTWEGDRANNNLLDVLIEIADYTVADFGIVGTGSATFEFRWRDTTWGEDRTIGNSAGNPPIIFSPERGNVQRISVTETRLEEANVVYVLGPGVGDVRIAAPRANAVSLAASPWARRAVARDASGEDGSLITLYSIGDRVLESMAPRTIVDFTALQGLSTRYIRDYDLGDLVTVQYRDFSTNQKIIGVRVTLQSNGVENISLEMDSVD